MASYTEHDAFLGDLLTKSILSFSYLSNILHFCNYFIDLLYLISNNQYSASSFGQVYWII